MIGTKVRRISNSSLGWINLGPRVFKMMWDRELRAASSPSLDLGSAIHCYILERERFDEQYVVNNVKPVGGMMGDFIRAVHQVKLMKLPGEDLTEEEYETLRKACGFTYSLERVMRDFNKSEYDDYKASLEQEYGKIIISQDDMDIIHAIHNGVSNHVVANKLLYDNSLPCENEFSLEAELPAKYSTLKAVGIIDRLLIDHDLKKCYLVDLKTTSGSVYLFRESYDKYHYSRQMAFYRALIRTLYPEYDIEVFIVAVQTKYVTHTADVAVYSIDELELQSGEIEFQKLLDKVSWHMSHDIWDHPQEYYESNGVCLIGQNP